LRPRSRGGRRSWPTHIHYDLAEAARAPSGHDKIRILTLHDRLKTNTSPINAPRKFAKAQWMKPGLMVDAEFRRQTGEGLLRHPAFKGIRRDLE